MASRLRVVAEGDGAMEAREDAREHPGAEGLAGGHACREEREEDQQQRVRQLRLASRQDELPGRARRSTQPVSRTSRRRGKKRDKGWGAGPAAIRAVRTWFIKTHA